MRILLAFQVLSQRRSKFPSPPPLFSLCGAGAAGTGQELHNVTLQASVSTGHCACLIPGSEDDAQSIALLAGPNGEHHIPSAPRAAARRPPGTA